jgi:hypothetical protein
LAEYDPQRICTDVFYFDGVLNVQKAGEVLMARFPHTFCFHGGEHVVLMFFSSIAQIKPINVCNIFALFEYFQSFDLSSFLSLAFDSQNMPAV